VHDRRAKLLVEASFLEDLRADVRVLIGGWELLVVEVVQQPGDPPANRIIVRRVLPRTGLHGLLHGQSMLSKGIGLRVLMQDGQGVVAGLVHIRNDSGCRRWCARCASSGSSDCPSRWRSRSGGKVRR